VLVFCFLLAFTRLFKTGLMRLSAAQYACFSFSGEVSFTRRLANFSMARWPSLSQSPASLRHAFAVSLSLGPESSLFVPHLGVEYGISFASRRESIRIGFSIRKSRMLELFWKVLHNGQCTSARCLCVLGEGSIFELLTATLKGTR
jgi:hypothetical protein